MMTPHEKADLTLQKMLLLLIRSEPGIASLSIPMSQRRFLKELERTGYIVYKNEGWYPQNSTN